VRVCFISDSIYRFVSRSVDVFVNFYRICFRIFAFSGKELFFSIEEYYNSSGNDCSQGFNFYCLWAFLRDFKFSQSIGLGSCNYWVLF